MTALPPLRVLALVTDAYGGHGGIAQYNRDFLSALAALECIAEVIVMPRGGAQNSPLPSGLQQLRPINGKLLYSFSTLAVALKERPIDLIFCGHLFMLPLASVIAALAGAKLWAQVHGIDAWQELSGVHQRALARATLVTSVSRYTRRRLLQWANLDPRLVKVLPNTVSPRFTPGPKPRRWVERFATADKKILMTVSRLASSERYKGQDRVIRILPQVLMRYPETLYLIVGDGDDRPRLLSLVAELGLAESVRFVGNADENELPDVLRLADVFVMPSTGEGFGIVFLEAMASGIAVIGGNQDGSLDPLGDGTRGLAVDPENADQLASAICKALSYGAGSAHNAVPFTSAAFTVHLRSLVTENFVDRSGLGKPLQIHAT